MLRTTRFNTEKFYIVLTLFLCILYGCQEQTATFTLHIIK
jgi:hypothetical protein